MKTQSADTSLKAERVQIELLRKATIPQRFRFVLSSTRLLLQASLRTLREQSPTASDQEIAQTSVACRYGQALAESFQQAIARQATWKLSEADLIAAMTPLVEVFDQLNISYHIGGSLASSVHGLQQIAQDIDVVVALPLHQVPAFVRQLSTAYALEEEVIHKATQERTSFSLLHLPTLLKIDVFLLKGDAFYQQMQQRASLIALADGERAFLIASAEDTILIKLERYQHGGAVADGQWNDILGILKVQDTSLDFRYLQHWARRLALEDLLEQACIDAGLNETLPRFSSLQQP